MMAVWRLVLIKNKPRDGVNRAIADEGGRPVPAGKAREYFAGRDNAIPKLTFRPVTRHAMIFDLDHSADRVICADPMLPPESIAYVLMIGEVVIAHGAHTAARPGKALYGPGRIVP